MTLSYSETLLKGFKDNSSAFKSSVRTIGLLWMKPKRSLSVFSTADKFDVHFNGKLIEQVRKYLGTIVRCTKKINQDIFSKNSSFISDKSRKAISGLQKKVTFSKILPPKIRFEMSDTMIKPILAYNSDVWGINKNAFMNQIEYF